MRSTTSTPCRVICSLLVTALSACVAPQTLFSQTADDFNPTLNGRVYSMVEQLDGRILIGGDFTSVNGQPRSRLARLNADGTLDGSFIANANSAVKTITLQRDGKILLGGTFVTIAGQPRTNLARLHPDGTVDSEFTTGTDPNPGVGTEVKSIMLQEDGKILVAGEFGALNNYWCDRLGRLNTNGTLDTSFGTGGFIDGGSLHSLAIQTDGKVLVAGDFTTLVGSWKYGIGRMTDTGMDYGFSPSNIYSVQYAAYCLAIQADGRILVGGSFTNLAGSTSSYLARLNTSGSVDGSLGVGANNRVNSVAVQTDGQIVVGGQFTSLNGQARNRIGRLNQGGSVDLGFNPDADGVVDSLAILADGKILVGGSFTNIGGQSRKYLARLNNDRIASQNLFTNGSILTWLRGGSSPEVWRTQFEYSTNGSAWINLGSGIRVASGWQVTGVSLPSGAVVRAWSPTAGGAGCGSGRFLQSSIGAPLCALQPVSRTNNLGTTATFTSLAVGAETMSYQWFKGGIPLTNGAGVSGTLTPDLTITNCQKSSEGGYSVVFTNASGSFTSVVATLTVLDPGLANQLTNQNRELGEVATFSVTSEGSLPFSYQWWKDGTPLPQFTTNTLTLTNLQASDAGLYQVVVSNVSGSVTSAVATLTVNAATVDGGFASSASSFVTPIAIQADGKILVGGSAGFGSPHRLNTNGVVDNTFYASMSSRYALAVQSDGKIVVAGNSGLGRLNTSGMIDSGFDPNVSGVNLLIHALALQPDGMILIGGNFTSVDGQPRTNLARLNADGTLDGSFNLAANGSVGSLAVQPDGKIVVGGYFTTLGGQPYPKLARLNTNGTIDTVFNPVTNGLDLVYASISAVAIQADGKILVGGTFSMFGGQPRTNLARLNPDGSIDGTFNPGADHNNLWQVRDVRSFALQTDGKILVGGDFTILGGQLRNYVARLNSDGALDLIFDPDVGGTNCYLNSVALQADGKILVGGYFTTLNGQARTNLARLNNTEPATQSFSRAGSVITWMRGGTGPEVLQTTFEHSADGSTWSSLGNGSRIAGGWQLTNLSLPVGGTIRGYGHVAAGYHNASIGMMEVMIGAPVFVMQPVNATVSANQNATFTVSVTGLGPFTYQWRKDSVLLTNNTGIFGALTPTLTLSNVFNPAEGGYDVIISNASGSITSAVAALTVTDPVITGQSIGGYREVGQNATFTFTVVGTGLTYQWSKNGTPLLHQTNASLSFTNLQLSDAASYRAVATGTYGSVTSVLGTLIVNGARLDTNFNATVNGWVSPVVVQPDGKIIFGGGFTTVGGQSRGRVARISTNGVLDTTFLNPNANDDVYALALQPDGKLLVGGEFTSLGGQAKYAIGRLNTNGALDTTFTASVFIPQPFPAPTISFRVQAMLLQPDGKIVVGGRSTTTVLNGQTVIGGFLYRLNTNGTVDNTFSTGGVNGGPIISLAQQPDGKILLGGYFSSVGGQTRNRLARINTNGALDTVFNPGLTAPSGINPTPVVMAVQPDGKIIVGGAFNTIAGQSQTNLARLNEDGTLDGSFLPFPGGAANPDVWSVALQTDGQILVSGYFLTMNGAPRSRLARLNADGTLDATFNPGANAAVNGVALQADGKILATGFFSQLGGVSRSYIGRLYNTAAASHVLNYNVNNLAWQRGGTSPEVWRTTFESSTNGTSWIMLGAGTRNPDGWQLSGATLPPGGTIRSRGYLTGGGYDAASWFVEDRLVIAPNIFANTGGFGFQSNRFSFNLNAPPGAAVIVEASTNLVHWSPVLTNLMGSVGDFLFQDLNSGLHPRRYYRAKFHFGSLPKPSFRSSTAGFEGGQFSFDLNGIAGQTVTIEASTNLADWSPLATNTLGIEPFLFSDATSSNTPVRFYRAKLQ